MSCLRGMRHLAPGHSSNRQQLQQDEEHNYPLSTTELSDWVTLIRGLPSARVRSNSLLRSQAKQTAASPQVAQHFAEFLSTAIEHGFRRLHVLAHSMGARTFCSAIHTALPLLSDVGVPPVTHTNMRFPWVWVWVWYACRCGYGYGSEDQWGWVGVGVWV